MKKFRSILTTIFILLSIVTHSQNQTVRGQVIDQQSQYPLIGATVVVNNTSPIIGTTTDLDGNFRLENVPLGRQTLLVSYLGYKNITLPNVQVTSGKEVVLEIELEESVEALKEVVISGKSKKDLPNNDMAKVSARTFSLEEVTRFSGGRNDVARLAASFAGVSAPNDSRNDIVVRGNSPTALLWRIEGIPVPNTNHFSTFGTTGGPVSALNTNLLKTSDFLTGAFPAEYGNANAAVFDIEMRNGNKETAEYTAQMSAFSGLEFMAEGPINKEKGSSYLASYRYGIASLAATGTSATPYYQDFSFKASLGKTKIGQLSVFGLWGTSSIDFLGDEIDETDLFANPNQDAYVESGLGLLGAKLVSNLTSKAYLKTTIGTSYNKTSYMQDNFNRDANQELINKYEATDVSDLENRYTLNSILNKKVNARLNYRLGTTIEAIRLDAFTQDRDRRVNIPDLDGDLVPDYFVVSRDIDEVITLGQIFGQAEYKFTDDLSITGGLHSQYLDYTDDIIVEPRAAISYQYKPNQRFSVAYGLHSQMAPLPVLFLTSQNQNGEVVRTNDDLEFIKSHHFIVGYDRSFGENWRMKSEVYYQSLFDVPVDPFSSSYSVLNEGADFVFNERNDLVNEGTASNIGIELTVEKFFSKGFYMLATGSIYESTYKGSDGIERSTAFNNQLVGNLLAGKEWKVGKAKRNALTLDTRLTSSQGNPFTPINLAATRANGGRQVLFEDQAFSQRYDDYLRWDVKFGFQLNGKSKKISHKFFVDFQNVLNRENEFVRRYNEVTDQINSVSQIGFFPDVLYRVQF